MEFVYNDGGRAAAGYKGKTGDCVARAIAVATQMPYDGVWSRRRRRCVYRYWRLA